jgi:hypothetical protein
MSLQIGAALKSGGYRLASRTGAMLTVCYVVLYAVYQIAYNIALNALYARLGVDATLAVRLPCRRQSRAPSSPSVCSRCRI